MKPTIAVIGGTGAEGSGLALRWARAGYPVVIGSRSAEKAATASASLGERLPPGSAPLTGATNAEAAQAADVVVLSVPHTAQEATLPQIGAAPQGQ
ncbi:F420-dependent NADP reductase, partial [Litorilinea aerophila]